jgi:polysaccharide biosynthesis transport protein
LLVDCDTRRHASSRALANAPKVGLVDLLEGRVKLEEVLLRDEKSGAFVLPQGPSHAAAYDIVQSEEMERLLTALRDQFDLIVLDTGPVIPIAESRVIAAMADKAILVVRWRKTAKSSAKAAVEQLRRAGASVLGTVLGQVDMRAKSMLGDDVVYYQDYGTPALA